MRTSHAEAPVRLGQARVEIDDWLARSFSPYDAGLVEAIRDRVPVKRWDRRDKCWLVPLAGVPAMVDVLREFCADVRVGDHRLHAPDAEQWARLTAVLFGEAEVP